MDEIINQIPEFMLKKGMECISRNREEFQVFLTQGQKLAAVKALKDYTGFGLKESKNIIDLYYAGHLKKYLITEDRKEKLERLAKVPLVDELIIKINKLDEDKMKKLLLSLSIDELFNIDDFLINE